MLQSLVSDQFVTDDAKQDKSSISKAMQIIILNQQPSFDVPIPDTEKAYREKVTRDLGERSHKLTC